MKSAVFFRVLIISAVIILPAVSSADSGAAARSGNLGRLPDGRAYRIDAQGYRLIDQVAELELTAAELKQQVRALESDLVEKDKIITKLQTGSARVGGKMDPPTCNELVSSLYLKVSKLESELKTRDGVSACVPAKTQECNYSSNDNPYYRQVTELEAALKDRPTKQALTAETDEKRGLQTAVEQLNKELQQERAVSKEMEEKLAAEMTTTARLEQDLLQLKRSQSAKEETRAALAPPAKVENVKAPSSPPAPAPSKSELAAKLNAIQSSIIKRKDLLDALKRQGKGITLALQPLVTQQGVSLDRLRQEAAAPESDGSSVNAGLDEITSLLREDIQTLQRLSR